MNTTPMLMSRAAYFVVTIAMVGLFAGCDTVPWMDRGTGQATEAHAAETEEGLVVQLTAPEEVEQNEDFEIQVAITNGRSEAVTLTTSSACPVDVGVFDDEERVPFEGTGLLCAAVITHHELSIGETLERTFDVRAELESDEEAVPSGAYTIRAAPNVTAINDEEATLPSVEHDLVVR